MRRKLACSCALSVVVVLAFANAAFATTITAPTQNPFTVPGDAAGNPQAFTISASGFSPGQSVFVEQCDGRSPASPQFDVSTDCDFGNAPGPVIADPGGNVSFVAGSSHEFVPFVGESPQSKFNCLYPGQPSPGNGLTDWTNCQLRVSGNNAGAAGDQVFFTITLPTPITETAPVPVDQAVTIGTGQTATITLTATDDVDGTPTTAYQITQLPAGGSVKVNGNPAVVNTSYPANNGTALDISYTAPASASVQTLKFQATDGVAGHNFGDGGTGTLSISVGTPPVDQELDQQVNPGQLVLSCNAPGSPSYPLLTCPPISLPAITLDGTAQQVGAPMNTIFVSDSRGDLSADWSLTSYMVPTASVSGCTTPDFCNSNAGADLSLSQNHIAATNLSLAPNTCAPLSGNLNPPATPDAGGAYGGTAIGLCHATHPVSGGSFAATGVFSLNIPASTASGLYKGTVEYLVS